MAVAKVEVKAKVADKVKAEPRVAEIAAKEKFLIAQAREGNLESFSGLVQLYQDKAVRTAYSILGNFEDAKDAAQEAFIKAHAALSNFRGDSQFFTWFYRILANTCQDSLRRRKMQGFLSFWKKNEDGDEVLAHDIEADGPSAREEAANRETGQAVFRALDHLPYGQRTVFAMRYIEGLSVEETAERLGLSLGAVKAHLWQAIQKMRKQLKNIVQLEES